MWKQYNIAGDNKFKPNVGRAILARHFEAFQTIVIIYTIIAIYCYNQTNPYILSEKSIECKKSSL